MTNKELEDFIKFGEENISAATFLFGETWSKQAIAIAKELQERLSQPKLVGFTEYEAEEISKGPTTILAIPELLESAGWTRKREWVGLTEEERDQIRENCVCVDEFHPYIYAKLIEAKLKEKNGG